MLFRFPGKTNPKSALFFLPVFFALLFTAGCGGSGEPDITGTEIELRTRRFDRAVAEIDTAHLTTGVQELLREYPDFLPFYTTRLLPFMIDDPALNELERMEASVGHLLTSKDYRGVFDTVAVHFSDLKSTDAKLAKGMQYLRHYLPEHPVPEVIYFVSGLNNWTAITYENEHGGLILGIGLDMFLGRGYPFYVSVGIPDYMTSQMEPAHIPVYAFRAMYENMHPFEKEGKTLLDMIIQRGKAQYFLSRVIPFTEEHVQYGFSKSQLKWCAGNEAHIYNFFIKENLLYETNWQKILRYVHEGPNSTGMPAESPGNIGSWLGARIIAEYMKKNPETTLNDLLLMQDSQEILRRAQYKPR